MCIRDRVSTSSQAYNERKKVDQNVLGEPTILQRSIMSVSLRGLLCSAGTAVWIVKNIDNEV